MIRFLASIVIFVCIVAMALGMGVAVRLNYRDIQAKQAAAWNYADQLPEQWRWFYHRLCTLDRVDRMAAIRLFTEQHKSSLPKLSQSQIDSILWNLDFYDKGEAFGILSGFIERAAEKVSSIRVFAPGYNGLLRVTDVDFFLKHLRLREEELHVA